MKWDSDEEKELKRYYRDQIQRLTIKVTKQGSEIEQLRLRVHELVKALQRLAEYADVYAEDYMPEGETDRED